MQQPNNQQPAAKPNRATVGVALSLAGGILILLRGLLRIAVGDILAFSASDVFRHRFYAGVALSLLGAIAVAFAVVILVGVYFIYTGMETVGGVLVIVFSLLSIFVGSGWLIGLVLGVIGGVLALLKM